ncbi:hypothetical protein ACDH07_003228 [Salmonella enterica]|nr:hypothetical protein [Salmonella enterica]EHO9075867.1 hypothetical protein [Salmonella enterica]EHY8654263.1 hypothetical protein [Salmonella enterica]EHZ2289634.1 hypothetical protein [Salmonella enterica]EIK1791981.1 hypothetical protein [Salmonella enterica]
MSNRYVMEALLRPAVELNMAVAAGYELRALNNINGEYRNVHNCCSF